MTFIEKHWKIICSVLVIVLILGGYGFREYNYKKFLNSENHLEPIRQLTYSVEHLLSYGEEFDYDFSKIDKSKDEYVQVRIVKLRSAGEMCQHEITYGDYSEYFWNKFPKSRKYLTTVSDYCIQGDFSDFDKLTLITMPLIDLRNQQGGNYSYIDFYTFLEEELSEYRYE